MGSQEWAPRASSDLREDPVRVQEGAGPASCSALWRGPRFGKFHRLDTGFLCPPAGLSAQQERAVRKAVFTLALPRGGFPQSSSPPHGNALSPQRSRPFSHHVSQSPAPAWLSASWFLSQNWACHFPVAEGDSHCSSFEVLSFATPTSATRFSIESDLCVSGDKTHVYSLQNLTSSERDEPSGTMESRRSQDGMEVFPLHLPGGWLWWEDGY